MIAVLNYPKGIGKHIVCIYSGTVKSAIQTKIGGIPEPPTSLRSRIKTAVFMRTRDFKFCSLAPSRPHKACALAKL